MEWNRARSAGPNNKKVLDEYTHYIPFFYYLHIVLIYCSVASVASVVSVASIASVVVSESHRILNESGIVTARHPIWGRNGRP